MSAVHNKATVRLFAGSSVASLGMFACFTWAFVAYGSELALAQAADSLADALTGVGLIWALRVSQSPPDDSHPFGHQGAEPVAALIVSILIGVLGIEVLREALAALLTGATALLHWSLAVLLVFKVAVKALFAVLAFRLARTKPGPLLRVFAVDARNDILLGCGALLGFVVMRATGFLSLDGWLALPIGVWIFWSGIALALESVHLLMGHAPPPELQRRLRRIAESTEGVQRVKAIKARHHGKEVMVWLEVHVDPALNVREAHDIGERVERGLLSEPGICDAVVHVDAHVG